MTEFNVGDVVEWTSQAAGVWKTKRGTIVQAVTNWTGRKPIFLVLVPPPPLKNGKPSTAKPKAYWPRPSHLRIIPTEVA